MALPWVPTLVSVLFVSLLGFVGVLMLVARPLRGHTVLLAVIALAAGTLLGDALLHLLPEAVEAQGTFAPKLGFLALAGFLGFFLFEALIRWQHAHGEAAHPHKDGPPPRLAPGESGERPKPFGWVNLASDGLHNFVDGGIIAATYLVDFQLGLATTLAVAIHEIPTEFGDFGVLLKAGIRPAKALLYNFYAALGAVAGALLVLLWPASAGTMDVYGVPIIAGAFVYIAAADLVPELHHHGPRYTPMILLAFLVGVGLMGGLLLLE